MGINMQIDNTPLCGVGDKVVRERYLKKDADGNFIENWSGLCKRVVDHVCVNENKEFKDQIYDLIYTTKFLPNSPCLVNSGNSVSGLFACFVTKSPEDSWEGMCENLANFGHIARRGGGCGCDFSNIRPEGNPVFNSTHAKACGPIQHMRVVSEAMSSITQAGFRSMANIGVLRVDHPDIEKFILCKQRSNALRNLLKEDPRNHFEQMDGHTSEEVNIILDKFMSNFNISVGVTDEFMKKVEKDQNLDLIFGEKTYKTVKAREIFNLIVSNAWKNGDPGLLFYDAINDGPYKYSGQYITATNPCFHGDTMVAVADGRNFVSIKQLAEEGGDVPVYACDPITKKIHIRTGRNPRETISSAEVVQTTFDNGVSIITTPDHKVLHTNGNYVEVQDLPVGDAVMSTIKIGDDIHIGSSKIVSSEQVEDAKVYNITVDDFHNLCVVNSDESNISRYVTMVYANCGEQNLPEWGACNLGSVDISKFYNEQQEDIDWESLKEAIHTSMQFLDDVIDVNKFPTSQFHEWALKNRPVGLGIMGWADLLLKMKIAYGSVPSIKLSKKLGKFMQNEAHKKSVELGKARGTPESCRFKELEFRRNVTLLSVAPTGSISLIAGCSSSIEPVFSSTTYREDNTGKYEMKHPDVDSEYFRCAIGGEEKHKITWQQHIEMQAAFQENCCASISKTINLENSATVEDVYNSYMLAWKLRNKGITVYRDRSKTTQVLNTTNRTGIIGYNNALRRPESLPCHIYKTVASGFEWHIIIGLLNGNPYEIFAVNGKIDLPSRGTLVKKKKRHYALLDENDKELIANLATAEEKIDPRISMETRRFSLELRHQIHPKYICEQIDKSSDLVTSFSKAVNRIMKKHYVDIKEVNTDEMICAKCAKNGKIVAMIPESACWRCPECKDSKCG
jgi:ribonucleoside-diphosphate reductase alpha chain